MMSLLSMRVFSVVLFVVSALAYQVSSPNAENGWTTAGPNTLTWVRVSTDPLNFSVFLSNVNSPNTQLLSSFVDGTQSSVVCSPPSGGWSAGSGFRVNLAQDSDHPDSLLAQSGQFNITASSSSSQSATSSASTGTGTSASTATSSAATSSSTGTTPTGAASAALLGADARAGLLATIVAFVAVITSLF